MTALEWSPHAEPEPVRVLVRHADAGDRGQWTGPDGLRPLSARGRAEAQQLVTRLDHFSVAYLLSSPALPCRQTVAPLASALNLEIEICPLLSTDGDPAALAEYLRQPHTDRAVLCTHRETLLGLFAWYAATGSRYIDGIPHMEKAAAWALYGERRSTLHMSYLRSDLFLHDPRRHERVAPA